MSFIICSLQTSRFNKGILVALLHNSNDVELLRLSSYSIVGMEGHLFKEYIRSGSKKGSKGSGDTEGCREQGEKEEDEYYVDT